MNYEKIKEEFSKGYELLKQWETQTWRQIGNDRVLYDFFDEQGILGEVFNEEMTATFGYRVYDGYLNNPYFKKKYGGTFKTRTEAEAELFTKCFEILETRLKGE